MTEHQLFVDLLYTFGSLIAFGLLGFVIKEGDKKLGVLFWGWVKRNLENHDAEPIDQQRLDNMDTHDNLQDQALGELRSEIEKLEDKA